jgi:uncharacterized protein involved in cysteine biosynthesis
LSFIPILAIINFILAAWLTAYSFLAVLYTRKEETLSGRVRLFLHDGAGNFLLGVLLSALLFVPVINVLLLGYAQILATLVFLHREEKNALSTSRR